MANPLIRRESSESIREVSITFRAGPAKAARRARGGLRVRSQRLTVNFSHCV
jgi:hypothetical protein